jgi:hypothetical protein
MLSSSPLVYNTTSNNRTEVLQNGPSRAAESGLIEEKAALAGDGSADEGVGGTFCKTSE